MENENISITDSPEVGVWLGKKFVPAAEVRKRIEEAKKKGIHGSCWICGKLFTADDYECEHTFE
jgi:hypothetical protein